MNDIEIKKQLNKIIKSNAFSLSGVYKRLLEYLTEETLKGEKPKEFTIGHAIFSQKVDDPSTSRVRVSVFKLRKRLEKYYKEEGINDQIYFTIPKGGYTVAFSDNKTVGHKKANKGFWAAIIVGVFLVGITVTFHLSKETDYHKLKRTAFWDELLNNDKETIVIAGDFLMYRDEKHERENGRYLNVRDIQINTLEQLQKYLDSDSSLKKEDYNILKDVSYMPRDALYSMQYIFPVLYENKIDYQIILSSDFNWETYKDYNLIYIGAFKNLKSLSILTDKLNIDYDNLNHSVIVNDKEKQRVYSTMFLNNKNIDYSLVAKLPGSNNNIIYIFVSDNDIGCIEAVKFFTQLDLVKNFEKSNLDDATFFKSIFMAEGIARTSVTFDMIEFETITDSILTNFWHY